MLRREILVAHNYHICIYKFFYSETFVNPWISEMHIPTFVVMILKVIAEQILKQYQD